MNKTELLQQLETMTYKQRMFRMYKIGKMSLENAEIAQMIDDLWQGNFYERFLAIQSCYGSGNSSITLQGLQDSSSLIRSKAIRLIALIKNDTEIRNVLAEVSFRQRCILISNHFKYAINALGRSRLRKK